MSKEMAKEFMQQVLQEYLVPLYEHVLRNPDLMSVTPGFLLNADEIVIYIGRTHIGIEYVGSELPQRIESVEHYSLNLRVFNYSGDDVNLFEKIIGFDYDSTTEGFMMPLPVMSEDL